MQHQNSVGQPAAPANNSKTTAAHEDRYVAVRVWSEHVTVTGRPIELLDLNAEQPEPHTLEMLIGKFDVRIHHTDEGIVVDLWDRECNADAPLASTYAFDSDADAVSGPKGLDTVAPAVCMSRNNVERDADDDRGLTAAQLDDKYNPDGDGEHPLYLREVWRFDVCERNTLCGYWEWVQVQIKEAEDAE